MHLMIWEVTPTDSRDTSLSLYLNHNPHQESNTNPPQYSVRVAMGVNKTSSSFFQMPLHYPRYSKKDYQNMPEWQLDMLLAEYGLPVNGDLGFKRDFAMGAFLWPDSSNHQEPRNSCHSYGLNHDSSPFYNKFKVLEFLYRVFLGHAWKFSCLFYEFSQQISKQAARYVRSFVDVLLKWL